MTARSTSSGSATRRLAPSRRAGARRRPSRSGGRASLVATTDDLLGVGRLANLVRERLHGDRTYFNINRHLNPTNVCVASCELCAFYVPWRDRERGWTYSVEQAVAVAERDVDETVSELHIVGGLHPKLKVDYYEELFRALKRRFPWIHLKALTMVELDFLASLSRTTVRGGGAPAARRRPRLLPGRRRRDLRTRGSASRSATTRPTANRWLEVARTVHRRRPASPTARCSTATSSAPEERVDHLIALRELQDDTGGFQCFIPLAFHPDQHRARPPARRPAGGSTCRPSRSPDCCSTTCRTSRPTGSCSARRSPRSRCTSAPTTSTAPSSTSASPAPPAAPPAPASAASGSST